VIRGIGIDAVSISEMQRLKEGPDNFYAYTFSARELKQAESGNTAQKLAGCFAAKEATFKAIARLLPKKTFDLRDIELLRDVDGSPHIALNDKTLTLIKTAQVDNVFVSITNENDLAIAFVVAEQATQ
jgi:phosphopantetheine--protein transferase-like protein